MKKKMKKQKMAKKEIRKIQTEDLSIIKVKPLFYCKNNSWEKFLGKLKDKKVKNIKNKKNKITVGDLRSAISVLKKRRRVCGVCGKYKNHSHYVFVENPKESGDLLSNE